MKSFDYNSKRNDKNPLFMFLGSILLSLWLSILELPSGLEWLWPKWTVLVMLYWCIAHPKLFGIFWAWAVGLFLDALYGTVFGQHALSMAIVSYLAYLLRFRFTNSQFLQQCATVFLIIGIYQLSNRLIQTSLTTTSNNILYYLPSLTSAALWPFALVVIRKQKRSVI